MSVGKVFLVGAGPGDHKLITVKGLELLQKADVVVHDRLAHPKLLRQVKPEAKLIYCGKDAEKHTLSQEEINRVLVQEAKQGRVVVRLKGGDPCIFGRVGEEAEECVKNGIPFEIVPGITSGIAAPAYAGIPLTHRDYNASVAIITGHRCAKNEVKGVDWEKVSGMETIVIYMGVKNLHFICQQLVQYGKDPHTPVALVRWGTTGEQETLVGDIDNIVQKVKEAQFTAPAIIVVGEVVRLRQQLNWFEKKILLGKNILLIDAPYHDDIYASRLEEWGADVRRVPAFQLSPIQGAQWSELASRIGQFNWVVVANQTEAQYLFKFMKKQKKDIRELKAEILVYGEDTAAYMEEMGIIPKIVLDQEPLEPSALPYFLKLDGPAELLLLDQGGNGLFWTDVIQDLTIHRTSLYERKYMDAHLVGQIVQREKVDLAILTVPQAASYFTDVLGKLELVKMYDEQNWTEEYLLQQLSKKIMSLH
jgi:uroporphyrinogen III methyltransferase / synthase